MDRRIHLGPVLSVPYPPESLKHQIDQAKFAEWPGADHVAGQRPLDTGRADWKGVIA
jgi:hypothetical protein